ncbi:TNT domain-containing protein [Mycolicibacterium doricum]|nr:TNT domain-containing protein [Mycolicibacterium doricum]
MVASAGDHDATAENLGTAATGMGRAQEQSELIANQIKSILNDAAEMPYPVEIDQETNQVIAPNTDYLTDDAAAEVAAKVTHLQERIAAVEAAGRLVDADLAQAIRTASTTDTAPAPAPRQIGPFAVPPSVAAAAKPADDAPTSPDSLGGALEQLAGQPVPASAGDSAAGTAPVPLDPKAVESAKATARRILQDQGVPADQIEARLDAMIAAARQPLSDYKPTEKPGPAPSVSDGFAEGWFNTEEHLQDLIAANGLEDFKDSWTDTAKGTWERITNPIDSWTEEVEHATKYPGHYLGEQLGETAVTAPGAILGGEAALVARAGAGELDDLAAAGANAHTPVPNDLIDNPTPTIDHPIPLPGSDHHTPVVGDHAGGSSPHAPVAGGPLPADSPLFDGYHPTPPGPEFTNPDGSLVYPDDSLPSKPYAVQGTVVPEAELPAGTVVDRFGHPGGAWLAPDGTPFTERALPPGSAQKDYFQYVVDDPTALPPGYHVEQSDAASWFHQPGGGTQYRIIAPPGEEASVQKLLDSGFLKEIE